MTQYQYDERFFSYQQIGSLTSARAVVPLLLAHLPLHSVLDVGCGAGAWLRAYAEAGVADVRGVDGGYLRPEQLLVGASCFTAADVGIPFRLSRAFDLAQCLEVAEHLDPQASETLVDNLVAHAPAVLFSAAPPGQGGEHHVNEQPYEFWRDLFLRRGYELFDFVRPRIAGDRSVEPWYRYNILLFVRRDATALLPAEVTRSRIDPASPVPDVAPLRWRARRHVLAALPETMVSAMAAFKHRLVLRAHAGAERP
jgi:SAM-dependent methyltransferase